MKDIIGMPGLLVTLFRILPMWSKLEAVAKSLPYDSAVMGDFSLPTKRAASLTMPTLVISGEKSMPVLREAAQRLAAVIPGARLRTLPGQTHNVPAKALAPVLKEFFAL
jgi:pimeloyl-ACP methyl ester carboxylesterase